MHNAAVAEWIVSLVVAPDRAASTVGDLVEEASLRGALWFWSCVLRTAGSHLWHDLTVSPLRMLGLAFWGVGASWLLTMLVGAFVVMVRMKLVESVPAWEPFYGLVVVCFAAPLLAGWELGRRADGRELSAALAVATLFAALYVLSLYLSAMQVRRIGRPWPGMEHALAVNCAQALSVIAGAILFRRRRHKVAYSRACR
jgi:hypothetical protein